MAAQPPGENAADGRPDPGRADADEPTVDLAGELVTPGPAGDSEVEPAPEPAAEAEPGTSGPAAAPLAGAAEAGDEVQAGAGAGEPERAGAPGATSAETDAKPTPAGPARAGESGPKTGPESSPETGHSAVPVAAAAADEEPTVEIIAGRGTRAAQTGETVPPRASGPAPSAQEEPAPATPAGAAAPATGSAATAAEPSAASEPGAEAGVEAVRARLEPTVPAGPAAPGPGAPGSGAELPADVTQPLAARRSSSSRPMPPPVASSERADLRSPGPLHRDTDQPGTASAARRPATTEGTARPAPLEPTPAEPAAGPVTPPEVGSAETSAAETVPAKGARAEAPHPIARATEPEPAASPGPARPRFDRPVARPEPLVARSAPPEVEPPEVERPRFEPSAEPEQPAARPGRPGAEQPAALGAESEQPTPEVPDDGLTPAGRLLRAMRPRTSRGQLLAGVLLFVLGFALFAQARQTQGQGLASLSQSDLVRILDNVTQQSNRLEDEARQLQLTHDRLQSGTDRSAAAQQAARDRLNVLGILAGTAQAEGPGIELEISDPRHKITAAIMLDALQELRDAGAEAVQIGPVRVVASTYFVDDNAGIRIDGRLVSSPYRMIVIGDSQTLQAALSIPGGVMDVIAQQHAAGKLVTSPHLLVSALRSATTPQYARPAPSASP